MKTEYHPPTHISTDFSATLSDFQPYIEHGEWVEANRLYGRRIPEITEGRPFQNHFIMHIDQYDGFLKRFVIRLFRHFGIVTRDFRCDFFLTKQGGELPYHIDSQSLAAFLLPLNANTGFLHVKVPGNEVSRIQYQSMIVLNTQLEHKVTSPRSDRLMFRIGIHDQSFDSIVSHLDL